MKRHATPKFAVPEKRVKFTLRMSSLAYERLKRQAELSDKSLNDFILDILTEQAGT